MSKPDKAQQIVDGLGGLANIVEVEPCITRLRTEVEDPALVDQAALKAAGAYGVVVLETAEGLLNQKWQQPLTI